MYVYMYVQCIYNKKCQCLGLMMGQINCSAVEDVGPLYCKSLFRVLETIQLCLGSSINSWEGTARRGNLS